MRPAPHDVRRARVRRGPLVGLTAASSLALAFGAIVPSLAAWLGPPSLVVGALAACAVFAALAAYFATRNQSGWSSADDVAWIVTLTSLSVAAGVSRGPVSVHAALYAAALIALAVRDPSGSLVVIACATTALMPVVRMLLMQNPTAVAPLALFAVAAGLSFVATLQQTRRLVRALAQRDAVLLDRDRPVRVSTPHAPPPPPATARVSAPWPRVAAAPTEDARRPSSSDALESGWDALVERVRSSVVALASNAGVEASVQAELTGLAPPSNKIRVHLVRIVQEAATQALRHAEPRSITVTLRRGDGGVVFELEDDGPASEMTRSKRTLATLRGRVAALGGTAEMRRADRGWVMRVRLPCEQLN